MIPDRWATLPCIHHPPLFPVNKLRHRKCHISSNIIHTYLSTISLHLFLNITGLLWTALSADNCLISATGMYACNEVQCIILPVTLPYCVIWIIALSKAIHAYQAGITQCSISVHYLFTLLSELVNWQRCPTNSLS